MRNILRCSFHYGVLLYDYFVDYRIYDVGSSYKEDFDVVPYLIPILYFTQKLDDYVD